MFELLEITTYGRPNMSLSPASGTSLCLLAIHPHETIHTHGRRYLPTLTPASMHEHARTHYTLRARKQAQAKDAHEHTHTHARTHTRKHTHTHTHTHPTRSQTRRNPSGEVTRGLCTMRAHCSTPAHATSRTRHTQSEYERCAVCVCVCVCVPCV